MTLEQVQSKLDVLKSNLEKLSQIPQGSYEEFASDFRNLASALYLLQTCIQSLIDLGSYVVAAKALPTPKSSYEVFEELEQAGHVPAGWTKRVAPIVGFRYRIVHLYDRV